MKVRLLDGIEEKGVAQVEQELIEKHEQQFSDVKVPGQDAPVVDTIVIETPVAEIPIVSTNNELSEEQVLSYIGK